MKEKHLPDSSHYLGQQRFELDIYCGSKVLLGY